ncbi:hypothetical protein HDU97_005600 [Phlyctochytrium planicorne]|nr:hypothetical protein HDU97_005600 [Phlyctochytrium planicorne]
MIFIPLIFLLASTAQARVPVDVSAQDIDLGSSPNIIDGMIQEAWNHCTDSGCGNYRGQFGTWVNSPNDGIARWQSCNYHFDGAWNGWDKRSDMIKMLQSFLWQSYKDVSREIDQEDCSGDPPCHHWKEWVNLYSYPAWSRHTAYNDQTGAIHGWLQFDVQCSQPTAWQCPSVFGTATSLFMMIPHEVTGIIGNYMNALCSGFNFKSDSQLAARSEDPMSDCDRHYLLPPPATLAEYDERKNRCISSLQAASGSSNSTLVKRESGSSRHSK